VSLQEALYKCINTIQYNAIHLQYREALNSITRLEDITLTLNGVAAALSTVIPGAISTTPANTSG